MKNRIILFGAVLMLFTSAILTQSCKKIEEAASFDLAMNMPNKHFDLDSANTAVSSKGETLLYESSYSFNLDSVLKANGADQASIDNGAFKEIELHIDNPGVLEEFGFLSSASFQLSLTPDFSEYEVIAEATKISKGDVIIVLNMKGKSLNRYLKNHVFYFRLYGKVEKAVPVAFLPLIIKSKLGFTVHPI